MTDKPSKPRYTGIDKETTRRAQETADRSRETAAAPGEYVDAEYMAGGPVEAARRRAETVGDVEHAVDTAKHRSEEK